MANWLYAILFFLVFTLGGVLQAASAGWGLLATELLLILLPVVLVLRLLNIPLRRGLSLTLPARLNIVWCILSGVGLGLFSQWLLILIAGLTGYSLPVMPQLYPRSISEAGVLLIGLLVAAPVCEEALFRGVIMGAYRKAGAWRAIMVSAILFAVFHSSLQRFLILLPLAVLTGYIAWRMQSLVASMLVHAGYNLIGSLGIVLSATGSPQWLSGTFSALLPWAGAILAGAGIVFLHQKSRPGVIDPPGKPPASLAGGFRAFSSLLPFILVLPLFLIPAASEVISGKFPERLAEPEPAFLSERWIASREFRYELRNILDQPVGEAVCLLTRMDQRYHLECSSYRDAFEAQAPGSYFNLERSVKTWRADWSADGQVIAYESIEIQGENRQVSAQLEISGAESALRINQTGEAEKILILNSAVLLPDEWPWRLQALPFGYPYRAKASLAWLGWWSQDLQQSLPAIQPVVINVVTAVPVETPSGNIICWKVRVGDRTAYYSVDAPYQLIRYEDGIVSYTANTSTRSE